MPRRSIRQRYAGTQFTVGSSKQRDIYRYNTRIFINGKKCRFNNRRSIGAGGRNLSSFENGISAVNKNTGVVSVNIPLLTAANGKLSTSIALSYASAGIKVDEVAAGLVMGWSLNAGG